MLEFDLSFLRDVVTGKTKPIFLAARDKESNLIYVAKNRKAKRLIISKKLNNIIKKYDLISENGYIKLGVLND